MTGRNPVDRTLESIRDIHHSLVSYLFVHCLLSIPL